MGTTKEERHYNCSLPSVQKKCLYTVVSSIKAILVGDDGNTFLKSMKYTV